MPLIPITVVTGSLGAGKTCFIASLVEAASNHNLGVVVPRVGGLAIDHDRLAGLTANVASYGVRTGAVPDDGELVAAFDELAAQPSPVEHVIIELPGFAPTAAAIWALEATGSSDLSGGVTGVVAVVDAARLAGTGLELAVRHRLGLATQCVLTKTSRLTPRALAGCGAAVRVSGRDGIDVWTNDEATTAWTLRSLEGNGIRRQPVEVIAPALPESGSEPIPDVVPVCGHDVDRLAFGRWLSRLNSELGSDLERVKAVLSVRDEPNRLFVDQVGSGPPHYCAGAPWFAPGARRTEILVIGHRLPQERIVDGLVACATG